MSQGRNTTIRDRDRKAIARTKPDCALCREPIDYSLPYLDPLSYVVDHIVPLAKGGVDELPNKQAAHRTCNQTKAAKLPREVVLICGPPGAGKSTLAHTLGLPVFDLDDPQWSGNDRLFRDAIKQATSKPDAQAAVIRSGATLSARQTAASLCGATSVVIVDTDLDTCIGRIQERRRLTQPIRAQIAAAQQWWSRYEPGPVSLGHLSSNRTFVTERTW